MKWKKIKKVIRAVKTKIAKISMEEDVKVDSIQKLIANGNLIIGEDCLIEGFTIYTHELTENFPNITIGCDCHLMGQIELYSPTAKIKIGNRVSIGPNTKLFCRESITIEDDVMVSWGCTLIDTNAHSLVSNERKDDVVAWKKGASYKNWSNVESRAITIKLRSWIGFNSIITKGVTISEGTVVGCGSVVTKSTANFSVVGGNPASLIKHTA